MDHSSGGLFGFDSPVWKMITYLFPENCFEELVIRFDIFHEQCVSLVLSRFLGVGILAGAILVKVPQILKLFNAKSGVGVSVTASLLELLCVSITAAYSHVNNFPFGTWGESLFIGVQNLIIVSLLFWYARKQPNAFMLWTFCAVAFAAIYLSMVPKTILTGLQFLVIPLVIGARLIQILENQKNQSTGQLSMVTVTLIFLGGIARIFTSMRETGDSLTIWTYVLTSVMNGILVSQFFMYWGQDPRKKDV